MLELPNVTLVCAFNVCHDLSLRAVDDCARAARFGAIKIFTDDSIGRDFVPAHPFSTPRERLDFVTYEIPKHITTTHILNVQWDSWIIDPAMWRDDFLNYDYIGAPWWFADGFNVGNSGFCLRSKRLIDFLAANPQDFPPGEPEDLVLCRDYRKRLLQFRWAPQALAHQFAFERVRAAPRSFGYHGMFNWPHVMTDEEIEERLAMAPRYVAKSGAASEMRALMAARARV